MSPRPENEPDENEPDEDESPSTKTHHRSKTLSGPSPSASLKHPPAADPSSALSPSPPANDASAAPASTIAPLVVALVVIVALVTCCILFCGRLRKRMNNEQRTQSINGWPSFLARFQTPEKQLDQARDAHVAPDRMAHPDPAAVQQHYLMSKPPPLHPIENPSMLQTNKASASARLSSGWPCVNDSNKHESLATPSEAILHAVPVPLPDPRDKTAQEHGNSSPNFMKPDERT